VKVKNNKKIGLIVLLLILIFPLPYLLNAIILPGEDYPNAEYFEGEWFNHIEGQVDSRYFYLERWAHYYGKHGCEPEDGSCPYRGISGQWRLLIDYISEDKPFQEKAEVSRGLGY